MLDLDEMERIIGATTPPPWIARPPAGLSPRWHVFTPGGVVLNNSEADSRFAAHAREWVPALIAEVRRLRTVLGMVEWCGDYPMDPCLWCWSVRERGHAPNCPRQAALGIVDDAPNT